VNEIDDKWKPVIIWWAFFIINIVAIILLCLLLDKSLVEKFLPLWFGVILIFLGLFGLKFKEITFIKVWISYADSSDLKRKIGQTINVIGLIAGILVFFYGVYYFINSTR